VKRHLQFGLLAAMLAVAASPMVAAAQEHIDVLEDVESVVQVKDAATTPDFPVASVSRATCQVVVNMQADDGSSQQFQSCTLNDEPVMIPENQGVAPEATITVAGGECIWTSDYFYAIDESIVAASAFELVVTPSGHAFAWSSYPSEPLVCPEE
jgi:hypothetical protein